ncbi:sorting nexin-11 [Mastacembelus armatus]|uniref:Sorting nexin 11 n=1 Tax=Mastacembelus armatus TaxID=205130 RepID=A0A7N8Y425_9TELE|nr:uncharacterized protein LOC113135510 [Mastacembelus armatus]
MIRNHEEDEFVAVRVQDPRIQNEGSWNSYVDYKIFLHTNSKAFTAKTSCVRRRYSEFVWLRKRLQKNTGLVPVPDLPGKSFFSFSNEDFLERRRKGLQIFLDKVVHMTVCLSDSQLHLFLQTQLPVGHIQDCVQGHTPYTVTDAILTYASSNRGLVQAQEDDSIKEPSLTISYESMESPAPHQPSLQINETISPELLPHDPDPQELCDDDSDELQHEEKSSIRVSQKNNHLEAVAECDCGLTEVTFFLGDNQDDPESLSLTDEAQRTSCRMWTPVEVHSPMEEKDSVTTLDTEEKTVTAAQPERNQLDSPEEANTEAANCQPEKCVNSEATSDLKDDSEEQVLESDTRTQEEDVREDVWSEKQVLELNGLSEGNCVEHVDGCKGPVADVNCLKEPDISDGPGEEVDLVGTTYESDDDSQSLPSSNGSIVQLSDEESIKDKIQPPNGYVTSPEATHLPEVEASREISLDLRLNGCPVDIETISAEDDEDLQYMMPLDLSSTVAGGELTESSEFSILESSSVSGLAVNGCTEQEALCSQCLEASEETHELEVH